MLGAQIGQPPAALPQHAEVAAFREGRAVGQHQLQMVAGRPGGQAGRRQRVAGGGDRDHGDAGQADHLGIGQFARQRPGDGEADPAFGEQLRHGAERLDMEAQADGGEFGLEGGERRHQPRRRQHDIDGQADFGLEALQQAGDAGAQPVHAAGKPAGFGEHHLAGLGQFGLFGAAPPEHGQAQLRLQIVDGVADRRGGAAEAAAGGGEAAGFDDGDEDAELIEAGGAGLRHFR